MKRYDLTDFEWSVIEPLLPNKPRGGTPGNTQGLPSMRFMVRCTERTPE